MNKIEAVIFDMDGVMVDTLPLHHEASRRLWKKHGVEWTQELARNIIGMRIREALDWQLARSGLPLDLDELVTTREQIYFQLLSTDCIPMRGLNKALQSLQGNFKLAVATSSERKSVDHVLKNLQIDHLFNVVASGSDIKRSKPFPDIYQYTADKLGVSPERCVVIEDAEHGVIAGWLAGMHVIAIPNKRTSYGNFSRATKILRGLNELDGTIKDIVASSKKKPSKFKYKTVVQMYGDDYLGENPIFPEFINYGDWEQINTSSNEISLESRVEASANLYRRLLNGLGVDHSHKILEVASGNGRGGKLIQDEFRPQLYRGVDLSYKQVQRSIKFVGENVVVQARAEALPFKNGSFDRILSVEAIQHFTDPKDFFQESFRVLKPGGKIAICSFFMDKKGDIDLLAKMFPTVPLGIDKFIPITKIRSWLEEAGFSNVRIEPRGKHVWEPFVKWSYQVQPDQDWSYNWVIAYKMNMVDYFHIFAEKI